MAGLDGYNYESECTCDAHGVLRWKSNGRVPPAEHVSAAYGLGMPVDVSKCTEVRDAETRAFLDAYRANPPELTPEMLAEARAAFGAGAKVVDVITGRRIVL